MAETPPQTHRPLITAKRRRIRNWNTNQLRRNGFHVTVVGDQASLTFHREAQHQFLSLSLASNPTSAIPTASRITEIERGVPVVERIKHWQTTPEQDVIMECSLRFAQALPPPGLIENVGLWNAPLPSKNAPPTDLPISMMAVGISRSYGQYVALVAQDLNLFTGMGLYQRNAMPEWLDPTTWHRVRIHLAQKSVLIEIAQGRRAYTPILQHSLLHPAEPLACEFSIDNDNFPKPHSPVVVPDQIDIGYLHIRRSAS